MTRGQLESAARNYLAAIDGCDLDRVAAHFAEDAIFTIQTDHQIFEGRESIRLLWAGLFEAHDRLEHRVTSIVVDPAVQKVATEQTFVGIRRDGAREERCSAYHFDVGSDGRFTRAIVWIDGETPSA